MNTTTTTTPRTDALEAFYEGNGARWNQAQATLARTLEREGWILTAAIAARDGQIATLRAALEKLAVRDFEVMDTADCECLRASIRATLAKVQA